MIDMYVSKHIQKDFIVMRPLSQLGTVGNNAHGESYQRQKQTIDEDPTPPAQIQLKVDEIKFTIVANVARSLFRYRKLD